MCCPCALQPVALESGALTVSGGSTGITSTRSRVWGCHIPQDSPAAAFMLCLVRKQDKQRIVLELAGPWKLGFSVGRFSPLFGGFPLWSWLAGAEGTVKKEKFNFFFWFFFVK